MNIVEHIFQNAAGDSVALISESQEITYAQLANLVDVAACNFRLITAQRIGLDCPNGIAHVVLALAIVKAGKCLVPLASELVQREREDLIQKTGVGAIVKANGSIQKLEIQHPLGFDEEELAKLNPAFIRFSSGTTGNSKGIVLSHQSLLERITAANAGLEIQSTDRIVWILPMAHHFAVSIILYLWRGATTIIVSSHLAEDVLSAAIQHRGTVIYGAPFHHALLAAETSGRPWPSLRLAVSTAAALPLGTAEAFQQRYGVPLSQGLGVIEIGLPFLNRRAAASKPDSIGLPLPSYSAELRDGQLFVRGPGMLDAYLTPWRTRCEILEDGWFCTGDLARVDAEGDFHLEGRSQSVINVAGMKCFPEEIEAVLSSHSEVRAVRVSGRVHPKVGAVPVAEIVPKFLERPPSVATLASLCRSSLARYKVPVEFRFVEEIPLTASGKVKRGEVS
ncbi:MAG: fatty acid--CoA ligase family protein [Chthoniobacterales bacterium]